MKELIERLKQAGGPDRKLFEAAYVACFGEVDWGPEGNWHPFRKFLDLMDAAAWADAALTLINLNDGWMPHIDADWRRGTLWWEVSFGHMAYDKALGGWVPDEPEEVELPPLTNDDYKRLLEWVADTTEGQAALGALHG
jgi:hypothetical protein